MGGLETTRPLPADTNATTNPPKGSTDTETDNYPILSRDETRILDLYDRLEALQLEIALLRTQGVLSAQREAERTAERAEPTDDEIKAAEERLLVAKARYQIRHDAIVNVLIANPILAAVHAGEGGSVIEQDLLPLLQKRDSLSLKLSTLSTRLATTRRALTTARQSNMKIAQENATLAAEMMDLARKVNARSTLPGLGTRSRNRHTESTSLPGDSGEEDLGLDEADNEKMRRELAALEEQVRISRQRYRVIKGTASAAVVGSGLDWARDERLRAMVMGDDDEEGSFG